MRKFFIITFLLTLPLVLSGCVPNLGSSGSGVGADNFVKGSVVAGFPNVPLVSGAQTIETYGYQGLYGGVFITGDSLNKVLNFYQNNLAGAGWQSTLRQGSLQSNYVFEIKNDKQQGTVIVNTAADGKKTAITISVGPKQ